ncbi:sugar phosphate isomerase/epimerase family protein [Paenibacillus piscarius]|uniref:sugar phosphate isomerase/epimerase family protein n=1 Tax=Paenibacillus piscarius TaxID=1089681 RepID=UPI001EE83324|nr:sugar phosphate isomerase/epimerase [Paenibacillus piscarius]
MKLGVVSAILDQSSYEEMIDIVAANGMDCVEVACWPAGKAARRYAGVSHIDTEKLTKSKADELVKYARDRGVEISALAYYPNPLDEDLDKRAGVIRHLYSLIDAAELMGVNLVTTFLGRMPSRSVSENLVEAQKVWEPIIRYAESRKVRIAIENCPMLFTEDEWPGGQNLMTSPAIFRKVFQLLDSEYFGLNFDPSHCIWQQMDYIKPLYEFRHKIFHVHYKDIKIYKEKLEQVGILAAPLEYMSPKLPGLGDVDFGRYVSALTDIGYTGFSCIEIEDKAYERNYDDVKRSIAQSVRYLRNYVS